MKFKVNRFRKYLLAALGVGIVVVTLAVLNTRVAFAQGARGTATFQVFASGQLVRTSVFALVFDDNLKELRAIQTSLVLPDGTNVSNVITVEARRIGPRDGD